MEQPIHNENSTQVEQIRALEAQIRECYGRVAYSHKVHEKCADIYQGRLRLLKLIQIILSAITTGGLIVTLFGENKLSAVLAAIASATLLALNIYTKEQDLGEIAQKHTNAAGELWDIRESYLSVLTDLTSKTVDTDRIRERRDKLQEILKNIYQAAPRTIPKAYSEAQAALKIKEELTFSDEEIDSLLPAHLRRSKP